MGKLLSAGLIVGAALCGCTAPLLSVRPPASAPAPGAAVPAAHYRCDRGVEFSVRFADDSALIDSPERGSELLLRDAGGVTPQQTVYSNQRLRAEFGLGSAGRQAELQYLLDREVAHCQRD